MKWIMREHVKVDKVVIYCLLISILVLVILLSGCKQASGGIRLPSHWPIPSLTAPPGSNASVYDILGVGRGKIEDGDVLPQEPGATATRYGFGFKNTLGWAANVKHVEGVLKPLNYVIINDNPNRIKSYMAPDLTTQVSIAFYESDDCYSLEVYVRSRPLPSLRQSKTIE